jgi:nicotinamidase-related amidase
MRILKEEAVAVVVDIQERLLPHIHEGDIILGNCLKLIEGLKILSVPILITQQYSKGLGPSVQPVVRMIPDFSHIEKNSFSCYDEPAFRFELEKLNRSNVILCGIEAHVCVLQTCLDLLADGKRPFVVKDCISSRNPHDMHIAIERMRQEGARITTFESLLFELARVAGNETFKSISRIVK